MKERSEMNKASPAFDDSTIVDYDYGPKQRLRDKAFLGGKTVDLKKKSMCAVDVSTGHGASDGPRERFFAINEAQVEVSLGGNGIPDREESIAMVFGSAINVAAGIERKRTFVGNHLCLLSLDNE